jgi:peptidoglycan/LPS O-acetylase OafA/YrhL
MPSAETDLGGVAINQKGPRPFLSLRPLPSRSNLGTAPQERAFRPDVEGLRAIAIILVVLFHAGLPAMKGGFFGVDVFFVISGFVITDLLLRDRRETGTTSLASFYARRARRILPAAVLVIVVTLIATDLLLGRRDAVFVASDGRWTALFLGNFHFASVFTNDVNRLQPSASTGR